MYYKKALQLFVHCFTHKTDKKKQARLLYAEESENVLEEEIRRQRDRLSVKEFYYLAGRTTEHVLSETDKNDAARELTHVWEEYTNLSAFLKLMKRNRHYETNRPY